MDLNKLIILSVFAFLLVNLTLVFAQGVEVFTNPLRVLSDFAKEFDLITSVLTFLLSLVLLVVAVKAYKKNPSKKFLFVSLAFALFSVKWILKIFDFFLSPGKFFADASENVFELFLLGALFLAIFGK